MIRTITSLFDTMDDAQDAAKELMDQGIRREDISIVARDTGGSAVHEHEVGAERAAGAGAVGGTVLGGAVGLLVGAGLLAIPGIGPVLAVGPLAAAIGTTAAAVGATALGAGVGAGVGGLVGGLVGAGVPEDEAYAYAEGVRRGGTLMTVSVDSDTVAPVDVDGVLRRYHVVDINQRGADWRATGWDPTLRAGEMRGDAGIADLSTPQAQRGRYDSLTEDSSDFARGERSEPRGAARPDFARGQRSFSEDEGDYRSHFQSSYAAGGHPYDYYVPAYRYGHTLAGDTSLRGDRWEDVELNARQSWEHDRPNSWDEFKSTVRYAWEKARGKR